ncbi:hypothetical protein AB4K20DRAFT_1876023 [Rhizopus microsporus]|uniref:SAGA-associated factor 11 n=1 Tax=Rhizopus microsporus TaxID=58291 RepID=A0A1X0RYB0_RHIZD|nr:hypothetical protein BCV71DRAFT_227776 [Rhizopus microsporus]
MMNDNSKKPVQPNKENDKEAGNILFKRLLSDKLNTIDDLKHAQANLEKNMKYTHKPSKATLAFALAEDLINECIYNVVMDAHREIKKENSICQICQTKCKHYVKKPGLDIWGKSYNASTLPFYECVNCQKSISATRYAPHLEKCLGLSGRQSSRVATRRIQNAENAYNKKMTLSE